MKLQTCSCVALRDIASFLLNFATEQLFNGLLVWVFAIALKFYGFRLGRNVYNCTVILLNFSNCLPSGTSFLVTMGMSCWASCHLQTSS